MRISFVAPDSPPESLEVPSHIDVELKALLAENEGRVTIEALTALSIADDADDTYGPFVPTEEDAPRAEARLVLQAVVDGLKRRLQHPMLLDERLKVS